MALNVVSTKQALVDLVNAANKKTFTLDQISVGTPSDYQGEDTNARALFSAVEGKGYRGSVTVDYNRLTTVEAFGVTEYPFTLKADIDSPADAIATLVLDELAKAWNLPLTAPGEITSYSYNQTGGIDDIVIGKMVIDFSVNYVLHGTLNVTVYNEKIPLPTVITVVRLDGFKEEDVELEDNG